MSKTRILIIDDSALVRRLLTEAISSDPQLEVVGTAGHGKLALDKIATLRPDVITLDVEMPVMDGVETLIALRNIAPELPVIMCSALTVRGAQATVEALSLGAVDYVTKPQNMVNSIEAIAYLRETLIPKIRVHARLPDLCVIPPTPPPPERSTLKSNASKMIRKLSSRIDLVAIGVSTGGPNTLVEIVPKLSADFPVPIVLVQHMPPIFTAQLAQRLAMISKVQVSEAVDGETLEPGHLYVAPGGRHLEVLGYGKGLKTRLHDGPLENSCRPAVDVLFRSVANVVGPRTLGLILTGMGSDGLNGCQTIKSVGGQVWAQDEATSVVWGMPGVVVKAKLADKIIPLLEIADTLNEHIWRDRVRAHAAVPQIS